MKKHLLLFLFLLAAGPVSAQTRASSWIVAPFWGCQFDATNVRFTAQSDVLLDRGHRTETVLPAGTTGQQAIKRLSVMSVGLFVGKAYPRWVFGASLHAHGMWDVFKKKVGAVDGHVVTYIPHPDDYEDEGYAFIRYHRPWSVLAHGGIRFPNSKIMLLFGAGISRCHTGLAFREYHLGALWFDYNIYRNVIPNPNYRPVFRVTGVWRSMFASLEYMNGISAQVGLAWDWVAMIKRNQLKRQEIRQALESQPENPAYPRQYNRARGR